MLEERRRRANLHGDELHLHVLLGKLHAYGGIPELRTRFAKQIDATYERWEELYYPWMTFEKKTEEDLNKQAKQSWENKYGSTDDPEVQARIKKTVEFLERNTQNV